MSKIKDRPDDYHDTEKFVGGNWIGYLVIALGILVIAFVVYSCINLK